MNRLIMPVCAAVSALLFASCSQPSRHAIEGTWLQPVPGQKGALQGIDLADNGRACSVNMSSMLYTSWLLQGDKLTLRGTSIGNKLSSDFTATYTVVKLTPERLVLKNGSESLIYFRARK